VSEREGGSREPPRYHENRPAIFLFVIHTPVTAIVLLGIPPHV
jgi:hypothetical protein